MQFWLHQNVGKYAEHFTQINNKNLKKYIIKYLFSDRKKSSSTDGQAIKDLQVNGHLLF